MHEDPQPTPLERVKDYDHRICVAGTRGYSDYRSFSATMKDYVARLGEGSIIFMSGAAPSGADALIIRWAIENGYDWAEYPAEWDNLTAPGAVIRFRKGKPYNVRAGFVRNGQMAAALTALVTFYDGRSSGTAHMIAETKRRGVEPTTILIDIDKEDEAHGRK